MQDEIDEIKHENIKLKKMRQFLWQTLLAFEEKSKINVDFTNSFRENQNVNMKSIAPKNKATDNTASK